MEIAILFGFIYLYHIQSQCPFAFRLVRKMGLEPIMIQSLNLLYMPILLLPHIPSAATETIPLFLLDLHFAGKFEAVN